MTIQHKGIRRKTTDVLDDYGQAHYLQNVRLKRVGELGRRAGLGKSNMAQLAGPVQFMIGAWSNAPFMVTGTGGDVTGTEDPLALWTAATMRIPGGQAGQPVAPVINFITDNAPFPANTYVVGLVIFTPDITYDGRSGALSYQWTNPMTDGGVAQAFTADATAQEPTFDFDITCTPGLYNGSLQVTTALNGFSANLPYTFTVL